MAPSRDPREAHQRLLNNGCVFAVAVTALWVYGLAMLLKEIF